MDLVALRIRRLLRRAKNNEFETEQQFNLHGTLEN